MEPWVAGATYELWANDGWGEETLLTIQVRDGFAEEATPRVASADLEDFFDTGANCFVGGDALEGTVRVDPNGADRGSWLTLENRYSVLHVGPLADVPEDLIVYDTLPDRHPAPGARALLRRRPRGMRLRQRRGRSGSGGGPPGRTGRPRATP